MVILVRLIDRLLCDGGVWQAEQSHIVTLSVGTSNREESLHGDTKCSN